MIQEPVLSQIHHLPVVLTPFIGRVEETAQLIAQLGDPAGRLVTIMGPGIEAQSTELAAYLAHAARLLAWSWPEAVGGGITLAEALADVERAAATSAPQVPPGAEPPRGHPAAKKTYPGGLTAREVDVLRLVAQGLTDKEVAEALILSTRTVSTHLTSIYGKLQLSSRSAATRFVMEHGLA